MSSKVMIFGTASWPYASKARVAFGDKAVFFDVGADLKKLDEMLSLSGGRRQVPVIVDGDKVTVGFGGSCSNQSGQRGAPVQNKIFPLCLGNVDRGMSCNL